MVISNILKDPKHGEKMEKYYLTPQKWYDSDEDYFIVLKFMRTATLL